MSSFFRFPHTPHLAWLGNGIPRDDKVLSIAAAQKLIEAEVVVEEKVDGANLGISIGIDGELRAQNRGQYLQEPFAGQFEKLGKWLAQHSEVLFDELTEDLILFGEWCAARHNIAYDRLPDWFLGFDVYDRTARRFWSTSRRNKLFKQIGIEIVTTVLTGRTTIAELNRLLQLQESFYRTGPLEGIVVRRESGEWLEARAKLVRSDFTQTIVEHWSRKGIVWNRLSIMLSCKAD
jgi:ATP-dependent RNA circularization protein (DNA/RNA ligase family)